MRTLPIWIVGVLLMTAPGAAQVESDEQERVRKAGEVLAELAGAPDKATRSRGLFAGATINGASVAEDQDANARFYGKPLSSQDIVNGTVSPVPAAAKGLLDALSRYVPSRRTAGN